MLPPADNGSHEMVVRSHVHSGEIPVAVGWRMELATEAGEVTGGFSAQDLCSSENATPTHSLHGLPLLICHLKTTASLPSLPHLAFSVSLALSNQHRLA